MSEPREHCGDILEPLLSGEPTECVLSPGHQGSHADEHGTRWRLAVPTPPADQPDRHSRYGQAIRSAGDTAYGNTPFNEAITQAAMAVADAEQTQLRTENAELRRYHAEDRNALDEMRATIERLRDLLRVESKRANDAIDREEVAELAAAELPAWEAVYEPGNISDYLIGYTNSEAAAKGAAEAWMRSQKDEVGTLEWVPDERLAAGEYDRWFELIEHHNDGVPTGPWIIVRRMADEAQQTNSPRAAEHPITRGQQTNPANLSGDTRPTETGAPQ